MDQLDDLPVIDVEGAILRDLYDQVRARLKRDVPEASDAMIQMFAEAMIGRPCPPLTVSEERK